MCGNGYTLQSSLILSSTLYSNIKFMLGRKYFEIITKLLFFFNVDAHIWLTPSPCLKFSTVTQWPEPYSEPSQTSITKLFAKIAVNYLRKKLHLKCFIGIWVRRCWPKYIVFKYILRSVSLIKWGRRDFTCYFNKKNLKSWFNSCSIFCFLISSRKSYLKSYNYEKNIWDKP